jgi:hypothetical protein
MRDKGIQFEELRELLLELGFCESASETERIRFDHPRTGTALLFRADAGKRGVSDRDMVVVRRQLIDNGLIEPSELERFIQKVSA